MTQSGSSQSESKQSELNQAASGNEATDHPLLQDPGWLDVMLRHYDLDASGFALRFAGRTGWPVREIAEQRHCYPRAEAKLGLLHRPGMIYLREALEQASGFAAATWRAQTWVAAGGSPGHNYRVADLTGGLGVDSAAFARAGAQVDYCERQPVLAAIARHNHGLLELAPRIRWHTGDGMEWLASRPQEGSQNESGLPEARKLDLIYIDPSRRPGGKRVLSLQDSEPDVTRHLALIRSATHRYLIKLSPMMDPVDAARSLEDCVAVIAVSVDGELKELLADCIPVQGEKQAQGQRQGSSGQHRTPVQYKHPVHHAVMLDASGNERFRFSNESGAPGATGTAGTPGSHDTSTAAEMRAGPAGTLLFEPDPALFKMRLIDEAARRYGLVRIHPEIGYLTNRPESPEPYPSDFPGKTYRIRHILTFKPRALRKWMAENELAGVHIHQRGFPLTVDQLYRKLGCRMGEDAHLFATTAHDGQKVVIVADRIG